MRKRGTYLNKGYDMIIIGLCGNSGSGKGYVCGRFAAFGVAFIDTDKVYRERVLKNPSCVSELTACFGNGILSNGEVSKKALAALVFSGERANERLSSLNKITHKYIKIETEKLILQYEKEGYPAVLVDAPVLFESGFDSMCHVTVCVTATLEEKLERILKRDGIDRQSALARLATQLTEDELRARCTYEINNSVGSNVDGQILDILKDLSIEK